MTTIKPATVFAAVAEVSAILSRAYIAELEETRRNLLKTNITIRMTRGNLTALDANNHAHFTSTLSDRRVKIHSIWFSESENVLAPPLVTNYFKAIMCDCRVYKRHRPYDKSRCFSRPEDVEKPFPFSKAIMQDVTVSRFSVKPKANSASELRHNFTYIFVIAGAFVSSIRSFQHCRYIEKMRHQTITWFDQENQTICLQCDELLLKAARGIEHGSEFGLPHSTDMITQTLCLIISWHKSHYNVGVAFCLQSLTPGLQCLMPSVAVSTKMLMVKPAINANKSFRGFRRVQN